MKNEWAAELRIERSLCMTKDEIAYLLLRLTLGANIFLHGFSRLIGDHAAFAAYMDKQMHNAPLPGFLVHFVAVVLPWCEGTVGLLMILGLWTSVALIAGSLLMLTLQIGICLAQNWDVAGVQLIYVLLYFVLLTYCDRNPWSIDWYWKVSARMSGSGMPMSCREKPRNGTAACEKTASGRLPNTRATPRAGTKVMEPSRLLRSS